MNFKEILSKSTSFQPSAWGSLESEINIGEVITEIKKGKYANEVTQLRNLLKVGEKDKYDINKKRLPGVTFCANFSEKRRKDQLKEYHNLIVIDIDKLTDEGLNNTYKILNDNEYVFTYWLSPSAKGYKGLVHLFFDFDITKYTVDEIHKAAFTQLFNYFKDVYSIKLDISGSDTTRLCFLSFDPNLVFKETFSSFTVNDNNIHKRDEKREQKSKVQKAFYISTKDTLYNPAGKNNRYHRKVIKNIIKYLTKSLLSITNSYDEWFRVALAISNSFTFDIGLKYFIDLCMLDAEKFDEENCKNLLLNCYENSKGEIGFNTIIHFAVEKGFKYKKDINAESS